MAENQKLLVGPKIIQNFVVIFLVLLFHGCSPNDGLRRIPVYGNVVVNGQPLERGTINFYPTSGTSGPPAFAIVEKGDYKFTQESGPTPGKHRVVIHLTYETPEEVMKLGARMNRNVSQQPVLKQDKPWEEEFVVPGLGDNRKDFNLRISSTE